MRALTWQRDTCQKFGQFFWKNLQKQSSASFLDAKAVLLSKISFALSPTRSLIQQPGTYYDWEEKWIWWIIWGFICLRITLGLAPDFNWSRVTLLNCNGDYQISESGAWSRYTWMAGRNSGSNACWSVSDGVRPPVVLSSTGLLPAVLRELNIQSCIPNVSSRMVDWNSGRYRVPVYMQYASTWHVILQRVSSTPLYHLSLCDPMQSMTLYWASNMLSTLIFTGQSGDLPTRNTATRKEAWWLLLLTLLTRPSHASNYDNGIIHMGSRRVQ